MKLPYKPLPAIAPNNVTLLLGESIGTNIDASLSHAKELLSQRSLSGSVLYINTVQNVRSINESARKHGLDPNDNGLCIIDPRHNIYLLTIERGDLYRWRSEIKEYLASGYIQYVIINSWEFAGKNSRYREEAVFLFKELTNGLEGGHPPVNLLVYAEDTEREITAQKIKRSGFGKLAGIARRVENITVKQQFEELETEEHISLLEEAEKMETEILEANDPRIGTEDEPGIDSDEALRRFLARVKPAAKREWEESKKPIRRAIDVASQKTSEVEEEATSDLEVHFAPVFVPTSGIVRPETNVPREPIHLNNHKPDKAPVSRSRNVHSHIIKK